MVNHGNSALEEQLRMAEEAASEVERLESLAAQAPLLRAEVAKAHRQKERDTNRRQATELARREIEAAREKQQEIPDLLESVSKMVYSLYSALKEVNGHRREANQAISLVDRMDYEEDMEVSGDEQQEMGRDPKSIEFVVASRHGQARIKQLLDQMDPDFSYLRGCDLEEPLRRDVANFVLAHISAPERAGAMEKPAVSAVTLPPGFPG